MTKRTKEQPCTQEELIEQVRRFKKMAAWMAKFSRRKYGTKSAGGAAGGVERFFDTGAGRVRTLVYNMDVTDRLPLYVNMHGGGFVVGTPEMDDPCMVDVAQRARVKIISVDYSLAPEAPFPRALDECAALVDYAREHAGGLGIDPERIAIGGHSAGGNLAAAVCLKQAAAGNSFIRCAILDYPPLDIYTDAGLKPRGKGLIAHTFLTPKRCRLFDACYCPDSEMRKNPFVSPVYATRELLIPFPSTLILTAGRDMLCAEAELFRDRLREAGVDVIHRRFDNSPHGFTLSNKSDARQGWQLMIDFLKDKLA